MIQAINQKINVYKDKRNERMALNRRKIYEKKMKLEQNIIEKSRKTIILPTLKVNWSFFKINKKTKLLINKDNNANGEEIENKINYELLNYEPKIKLKYNKNADKKFLNGNKIKKIL